MLLYLISHTSDVEHEPEATGEPCRVGLGVYGASIGLAGYTNRSRDPGEKCHHAVDALTISFRRFKSISEAAFFVTFCIKCRSKISATAAEQNSNRTVA